MAKMIKHLRAKDGIVTSWDKMNFKSEVQRPWQAQILSLATSSLVKQYK
jgi:hypothetical protein